MISRMSSRPLLRLPQTIPIASTSRLPVSNFSSAVIKSSSVAFEKRSSRHGSTLIGASPAIRHLSWTPWKRNSPTTPTETPASIIADQQPILASTHPDLQFSPPPSSFAVTPEPTSAESITATPTSSAIDATSTSSETAQTLAGDLSSTSTLPSVPADATLGEIVAANPDTPLQTILQCPEAIQAACSKADLASIGLSHGFFSPAGWTVDALVSLHNLTGLPWWATIALMTILIRMAIVRTVVQMQKHNVRMQAIQPQMLALQERMKKAKESNNALEASAVQAALTGLLESNNVNPLRLLKLPMIQFPIFIAVFGALRRLTDAPLPQLKEGGFGWVTDLTATDPYYILPLTSMVFTNLVLKYGADGTQAASNASEGSRHMRNIIGFLSLIAVPFVGRFPAAMLFYWTSTNIFTLLQALIISRKPIKRLLKIPEPPVVPPPPGGVRPPPTFKETIQFGRNFFGDMRLKVAQNAADQAQVMNERELQNRGKGTAYMAKETIKERVPSSASVGPPPRTTGNALPLRPKRR